MFSLNVRQEGMQTEKYLNNLKQMRIESILAKYAQIGVQALSNSTPKDSGATAFAWGYEIERDSNGYSIHWTNDNINDGVNIAVILQYGHGTGTGGYVQATDYINPAMAPVFEQIADAAWNEVTNVR